MNFAFTGVIFTITLAMRQHGTSTAVIGLVQAAIAAGGLLGAVVAPRLQGRMRLATLATTIALAGAVLFGAAALVVPSPLVAAPVALAPLIAGLLVQHVSGGWAVAAFAATMTTAAVLCLILPGLRQPEPGGRTGLSG